MLKVGITGGIGSGKSTIAKVFQQFGVPVYFADEEAKKLMNENENLRKLLIFNFGEKVFENGVLNRVFLASIVFNDKEKLELLNSIVHPFTIADFEEWAFKQKSLYVLKEAALIFETEVHFHLDYIIGVYCPKNLRIQRVIQRDQVGKEKVIQRMLNQINEEIKMKLCDTVITNNDVALSLPQIIKTHEYLCSLARKKI